MMLAAFQVRAAVRLSTPTDDAGTIVTAGAGSGKTIAFYLPGMIRIGEAIGVDHWVKAVAIYPRIELLKDQFAEAFNMAEYQILLRGDPASRASLLSTTIQTSMLVPRVLDPPGASDASGAFGRRAFLFTDDLDVTNRLYDDLRDAEAFTIFGKPDAQRQPLANIRGSGPDAAVRDVEGQRWRICEDIGHPLNRRLIVGRTTSQDAGVNQSANIVVATAALEVGCASASKGDPTPNVYQRLDFPMRIPVSGGLPVGADGDPTMMLIFVNS